MRESNDVNCQGDEWMIIISVAAWVHSSSPDALFLCKTIAKILERKKNQEKNDFIVSEIQLSLEALITFH